MQVRVVGGGMVGLAFAIAVRHALTDADVTVLEARPLPNGNPNPLDTRASALNLASRRVLSQWGAWPAIESSAGVIKQIHVSNQSRFGSALMPATDVDDEQLGFVAENHIIGRALKGCAEALGVVIQAPAQVASLQPEGTCWRLDMVDQAPLMADLVIIADGSQSRLREQLGITVEQRRTGQYALVANVLFDGIQQGTAFERFTAEGPLAMLPLPDSEPGCQRFNLVWSMAEERAIDLEQADDTDFMAALQTAFGWRLGAVRRVGRRSGWPLDRLWAREQVRPGCIVAGNAAHGIHPVAGQGLNLSLRDAATLADVLATAPANPFSAASLREYGRRVMADQAVTVGATDMLATLFQPHGPVIDLPRDAALAGLDLLTPLRKLVARRGTAQDWSARPTTPPASVQAPDTALGSSSTAPSATEGA